MDLKNVWFALGGAVFGWLIFAFICYPPQAGWVGHMKVGDLGTWVAAFGTLCAVVVALGVALLPIRQRERERRSEASLIARLIGNELAVASAIAASLQSRIQPFVDKNDLSGASDEIGSYSFLQMPLTDDFLSRFHCFKDDELVFLTNAVVAIKSAKTRLQGMKITAGDMPETAWLREPWLTQRVLDKLSADLEAARMSAALAVYVCETYGAIVVVR